MTTRNRSSRKSVRRDPGRDLILLADGKEIALSSPEALDTIIPAAVLAVAEGKAVAVRVDNPETRTAVTYDLTIDEEGRRIAREINSLMRSFQHRVGLTYARLAG